MMARLMTLLGGGASDPTNAPEPRLDEEWLALLAAATSPAERDEINDFFGRAAA